MLLGFAGKYLLPYQEFQFVNDFFICVLRTDKQFWFQEVVMDAKNLVSQWASLHCFSLQHIAISMIVEEVVEEFHFTVPVVDDEGTGGLV